MPFHHDRENISHDTAPFIYRARRELAVCLLAGTSLFSIHACSEEKKEILRQPIAFSEHGQIRRDHAARGETPPPLTSYYASMNDFYMKVREASNNAVDRDNSNLAFAEELRAKVQGTDGHHALAAYAREIPQHAQAALLSLKKYTDAEKSLPGIIAALDDTWKYDVEHHTSYECSPGFDLESGSITLECDDEYSHSTHTYTYNPEQGRAAAEGISALVALHPDLKIPQALATPSRVNADNMDAILKTNSWEDKKNLEGADVHALAKTWATGSVFAQHSAEAEKSYQKFSTKAAEWTAASGKAKTVSYDTESRYDDGPLGYALADEILGPAKTAHFNTAAITGPMHRAQKDVPALYGKIMDYVNNAPATGKDYDGEKPTALRAEIMSDVTTLYKSNFPDGLREKEMRHGRVFLAGLFGLAAGGAAGSCLYMARRALSRRRERKDTATPSPQDKYGYNGGLLK